MLPRAVIKLNSIYNSKQHNFYKLFRKKGKLGSLNRLKLLVLSQLRHAKKLPETAKLIKVLEQQKALLSRPKLRKGYSEAIRSLEGEAVSLLRKEEALLLQIDAKLAGMKPRKRTVLKLSKRQAEQAARLIAAVNSSSLRLKNAVGNRKEVQKAAKILLKHLARLQHTAVYRLVKEDAGRIRNAAKIILKNPREAKIKSVLAGIYLIAPFTFDATGAVVILRYAAKYAHEKSKRLRTSLKAAMDKRRRHIRVF